MAAFTMAHGGSDDMDTVDASLDDLPDEMSILVVASVVRLSLRASSDLRLASRRWCGLVDEVRGPPVDPWVLGRCFQFLVRVGKMPDDAAARRATYPTPMTVVEAATKAGLLVEPGWGPFARSRGTRWTPTDWPYDLYTCITEMGHEGWADRAALEICPACTNKVGGCVCVCSDHPDQQRDDCRECIGETPRQVKGNSRWDPGPPNVARIRKDDPRLYRNGSALPRRRFDTQPWAFIHRRGDEKAGRWFWLSYVARCYQFLVSSDTARASVIWRRASLELLPCAAIVRNAHYVVNDHLIREAGDWQVMHGETPCTWNGLDFKRCACRLHCYYYRCGVVEEDPILTLDAQRPNGGPAEIPRLRHL